MKRSCMTLFRALFPTILVSTIAQPQLLLANPLSPPSGSYELTARLELPHLERWGVDKTAIICLSNSRGPDEIPVPVVSANNPFAKCSATNLVADGSKLEYDIVCPERGAARAHAVYELSSSAFTGRSRARTKCAVATATALYLEISYDRSLTTKKSGARAAP